MSKRKVRVKIEAYRVISDALDSAVESAMNKADKWCEVQLTGAQRNVIATQAANYFWVNLEEIGVELV